MPVRRHDKAHETVVCAGAWRLLMLLAMSLPSLSIPASVPSTARDAATVAQQATQAGAAFQAFLARAGQTGGKLSAAIPAANRNAVGSTSLAAPAAHGSNHGHHHRAGTAAGPSADTAPTGDSAGAVTTGVFSDTSGDASGSATADVGRSAQSTADALSGDLMRSIQAYLGSGAGGAASVSQLA